jgi:hypothetical protein
VIDKGRDPAKVANAAHRAGENDMADDFRRFADFWPHYLREHSNPSTRALHYVGTSLALLLLAGFVASGDWRLLVGAPVAGYAFAWVAHGYVERNKPATFTHPLWSLFGDFYMLFCWATGRLGAELERCKPV